MTEPLNALNHLAKWRSVFAGWQLGTRPIGDPECDALRDHREATMILRAEVSALTSLLVAKGVITVAEWTEALVKEAEQLSADYEQLFPGMRATDLGIEMDERAAQTMRGWKP